MTNLNYTFGCGSSGFCENYEETKALPLMPSSHLPGTTNRAKEEEVKVKVDSVIWTPDRILTVALLLLQLPALLGTGAPEAAPPPGFPEEACQ